MSRLKTSPNKLGEKAANAILKRAKALQASGLLNEGILVQECARRRWRECRPEAAGSLLFAGGRSRRGLPSKIGFGLGERGASHG